MGLIFTPSLMYNAPIPLGPWSLWDEIDSKSTSNSLTSTVILPTTWTASVWKIIWFLWQILAIFWIGWMVPTSLFPNITDTRLVFSEIIFSKSNGLIIPNLSTGK